MDPRVVGVSADFPDADWPANGTYRLPADPASGRIARDLVRGKLAGCPNDVIDVAELLVSELVSNAVRYGSAPPLMRIEADARGVRVAIQDESTEPPQLQDVSADADGGRGIMLVDALAIAWGWSSTPNGKRVWFTL